MFEPGETHPRSCGILIQRAIHRPRPRARPPRPRARGRRATRGAAGPPASGRSGVGRMPPRPRAGGPAAPLSAVPGTLPSRTSRRHGSRDRRSTPVAASRLDKMRNLMVEPPLTAQPVSTFRFTRSLHERSPSDSGVRSRLWPTEDTHLGRQMRPITMLPYAYPDFPSDLYKLYS